MSAHTRRWIRLAFVIVPLVAPGLSHAEDLETNAFLVGSMPARGRGFEFLDPPDLIVLRVRYVNHTAGSVIVPSEHGRLMQVHVSRDSESVPVLVEKGPDQEGNGGSRGYRLDRYIEAIPWFERALKIIRSNDNATPDALAVCYLRTGQREKARQLLTQRFGSAVAAQKLQQLGASGQLPPPR